MTVVDLSQIQRLNFCVMHRRNPHRTINQPNLAKLHVLFPTEKLRSRINQCPRTTSADNLPLRLVYRLTTEFARGPTDTLTSSPLDSPDQIAPQNGRCRVGDRCQEAISRLHCQTSSGVHHECLQRKNPPEIRFFRFEKVGVSDEKISHPCAPDIVLLEKPGSHR
jgi:hypothetical protein